MSLTHLSSNLPETLWYPYPIMDSHPKSPPPHHHHHTTTITTTTTTTTTTTDDPHPKDPMFEKPLTPSDVGKLNRLVIPKQHAEKHFPLSAVDSAVDHQKGLLLTFEDEGGKAWRFRYSYWNSSQSYVLTKGWSRYVKEKRLDAGDVVLFERHRYDVDRMFIGWRRRPAALHDGGPVAATVAVAGGAQVNGWTTRVLYNAHYNYPSHHLPLSLPHPYQPAAACIHAENNQRDMVASGNPRRVRLFGVNLECPDEPEPSTQDGSSQGGQPHYQYYSNSNNLNHNMNINFSQMRYHQHQG